MHSRIHQAVTPIRIMCVHNYLDLHVRYWTCTRCCTSKIQSCFALSKNIGFNQYGSSILPTSLSCIMLTYVTVYGAGLVGVKIRVIQRRPKWALHPYFYKPGVTINFMGVLEKCHISFENQYCLTIPLMVEFFQNLNFQRSCDAFPETPLQINLSHSYLIGVKAWYQGSSPYSHHM